MGRNIIRKQVTELANHVIYSETGYEIENPGKVIVKKTTAH